MASHAEVVRGAVAHYRELSSGIDRGLTFLGVRASARFGADSSRGEPTRGEEGSGNRGGASRSRRGDGGASRRSLRRTTPRRRRPSRRGAPSRRRRRPCRRRSCSGRILCSASSSRRRAAAAPGVPCRSTPPRATAGVPTGPYAPHHASGYPQYRRRTRDISTTRRSRNRRCRTARGRLSPPPPQGSHMCQAAPYDTAGKARRRPRSSSSRRAGAIPDIHRNETCELKEYI